MISPVRRLFHLIVLAVVALAVSPTPGAAQQSSRFNLTAGATVLQNDNLFEGHRTGWLIATGWNLTDRVVLGVEVGRNGRKKTLGLLTAETRTAAVMAGPQVTWSTGPIRTFARLFAGAVHVAIDMATTSPVLSTGNFGSTHRALAVGGGVDVPMLNRIAVRIAYDLRRVFVEDPYSEHRFFIGALYTIG